jgi:hypothetical protein
MVADLLGIDTKKHTVYKTTAGITKKPETAVLGKREHENPEPLEEEFEDKKPK